VPKLLNVDPDHPVVLLGDEALCRWYERALSRMGVSSTTYDGEAAALAALTALQLEGA
jgi:2-keto-3-deoxy-galactonokinase